MREGELFWQFGHDEERETESQQKVGEGEGEEEGAEQVSYNLISSAVKSIFNKYFPRIEKLTKILWFFWKLTCAKV